ncbi:hypothetical protein SAMN05444398_107149 [Roseovarius pacificus]|uniref:Uncharacterized protein n=1 Tax=Roseovarius pacificus TaxID=337701 RepID=A0A1M7ENR1_9RHOB|nr:hypothetical protein [Roseovarius pacificus]GGO57638.1 hypothetical protein GCM10011315_25280 [Roseovarius pacificus]SHL93425.1 hypothetical protein SAMN05444398_107149 [Roseovarius pacificus]
MERDPLDHKGLIREAYRIDGITAPECRSIFLDWALSLPGDQDQTGAITTLLERYRAGNEEHPMTGVLQDGLLTVGRPRRRGGWKSRQRE